MFFKRFLTKNDERQLEALICDIEYDLENMAFWLPIEQIARDHFLDPSWTRFIGAFDKKKLIAASALFLNSFEYGQSAKAAGLTGKGGEIGRSMVSPPYRGHNLMLELNKELVKVAKQEKIPWILATVHPKNIASKASLEALGLEECIQITKSGYPRLVLTMSLQEQTAKNDHT